MDQNVFILIVEDEALIAMDFVLAVEAAGGIVVGPAASTIEALALIEEAQAAKHSIAAAVLDGNLIDRDVTPVALRLLALGVPIVMYSAVQPPPTLAAAASGLPWIQKRASTAKVVARLSDEIDRAAAVPA